MPQPKGTFPNVRQWADTHPINLATILNRYCKQFKTGIAVLTEGNYTQYLCTVHKTLVARVYQYRRYERVLISASLQNLIPENANITVKVKVD